MEATQLVYTYLNVEEMTNNTRVNDLLTKESTKPLLKEKDEPKPLGNKRSYRDRRDETDMGWI